MRLKTIYIRFYKSFNFDYLRKSHPQARQFPWEMLDGMWYPYVEIPIDPKITTVVGANESGKSHLLSAIEKGLTGKGIEREDFCRYSQFNTVEKGKRKSPDFGFEWVDLNEEEQEQVKKDCKLNKGSSIDSFKIFRTEGQELKIFCNLENEWQPVPLKNKEAAGITSLLPRAFYIDAKIALPDSVSIKDLAENENDGGTANDFLLLGRSHRGKIMDAGRALVNNRGLFQDAPTITSSAPAIHTLTSGVLSNLDRMELGQEKVKHNKREFELARDLLCKIAKVDPQAMGDLYSALQRGKEGHVNGLIQLINNQLEASLNFPKWWVQDRNFQLRVSPREFDLVFTIRDRTGTEYSFSERSSGLKYFLSYYVQYLAHDPHPEGREILLMDEPDAYLSSQAQQDLLKIFDGFANPQEGKPPIQVIYVTHSPFLIDKNHAERIRVLEKGVSDEGTRVVKDTGKNHYEPLRSAFGSFVGETTFIGSTNLMVEGQADQILLAGMATHLQKIGCPKMETLDLNRITIVPAGSSSHIPYLVYLARGRDVEQPAVIVLLDSDDAGNGARADLKKSAEINKKLLDDGLILQVGELSENEAKIKTDAKCLIEIEDLIPLTICVLAVRRYIKQIWNPNDETLQAITREKIALGINEKQQVFDAVKSQAKEVSSDFRIEKVGFARNVIEVVNEISAQGDSSPDEEESLLVFEQNMKILFRKLDAIRITAERSEQRERVSAKMKRVVKQFTQDNQQTALREKAHYLFNELDAILEDDIESDEIKLRLIKIRRDFEIDNDVTKPIKDYEKFRHELEALRYAGKIATQEVPK